MESRDDDTAADSAGQSRRRRWRWTNHISPEDDEKYYRGPAERVTKILALAEAGADDLLDYANRRAAAIIAAAEEDAARIRAEAEADAAAIKAAAMKAAAMPEDGYPRSSA